MTLVAAGLALAVAAFNVTSLRYLDGALRPAGWTWALCGLALALVGATRRTRWASSAAWLAVALAGQTSALQLISTPPWAVYQHYHPWRALLAPPWSLVLGVLSAQTAVVLWGANRFRHPVRDEILRFGAGRWMALLALVGFSSALGSENVPQFGVELVLTLWLSLVSLLNIVLVASTAPRSDLARLVAWLERRFDRDRPTRWNRALPIVVAASVVAVAATIASQVFERVPVIQDSVSYLFQAKHLAAGRLYLPAPPDAAAFEVSHLINDGTKWYGYGFPGWPFVLAIGALAGAPWLVNPVLAGLAVLIVHGIVRRLYGWRFAHAAVLLLAASPWFLFLSASHMPHTVTLVWGGLAWLALERARAARGAWWPLLSGMSLGGVFLTRPLEGILFGAAMGAAALGLGGQRLSLRSLAWTAIGGLAIVSLIFPYNRALTGDAFYPPQSAFRDSQRYPGADRLGFGPDVGNLGWPHLDPLPGHGAADVVINVNKNMYQLNVELFGWAFGSLLFATLPLLWRRLGRHDWLMVGVIVAVAGGHSFYWFAGGPDFGARYWFQMLVPLVVLTARGLELLVEHLHSRYPSDVASGRVLVFVAAATVVAALAFVPWRALGKYHRYRGMTADVQRLARERGFDGALVFVRVEYPVHGSMLDMTDYPSAFVFNPPTLDSSGAIYAFDAGPEHRLAVERRYPDRPVWFIGRTPTSEELAVGIEEYYRMKVLEGPLPPLSARQGEGDASRHDGGRR